jgi:hypothetical protein
MEPFRLLVLRLLESTQGPHLGLMGGLQSDTAEVAQRLQARCLQLLLVSASAQPVRVAASRPLSREVEAPQSRRN